MTGQETGTIYALVDPRTDEVRYVGQTTRPVQVRLAGHLAAPAPLVRAWIEALAVEGNLPRIVPIREGVPTPELDAAEKDEIEAHAERGDLLNVASNDSGNARRRKVSRAEAKRRDAEEQAMERTWRQATWRQVADQIRYATGGPISPADVPIRKIPTGIWETYQAYREVDRWLREHIGRGYVLRPGFGAVVDGNNPEDEERRAAHLQHRNLQSSLEQYLRTYRGAFSRVDEGDQWGSTEGVFDRALDAYRNDFHDAAHMARYLSLVPWAARALDPWAALAYQAGIDKKGAEFTEWVSDDPAVREAVELCRTTDPGCLGIFRRDDADVATYALALGAAHIPGFVVPHLLETELEAQLVKLAQQRQATREMCQLLQRINPRALDTVYGRDELAESDAALGLAPGMSAEVARRLYGGNLRDPADRTAKLLQRHAGEFMVVAVPDYGDWTGIHIPAFRATAACFCSAGLLPDDDDLVGRVNSTWQPTEAGGREVDALHKRLHQRAA